MEVQKLAEHLLLGEDDPPLRRGRVDRDDEHDGVAGLDEVFQDVLFLFRAGEFPEELFQRVDAVPGLRGDRQDRGALRQTVGRVGGGAAGQEVGLVERDHARRLLLGKEVEEFPVGFLKTDRGVRDEDRDIRLPQGLPGPLDPHGAEFSLVVDARRVDDDHRSDGQELHRL